ncbi:hypothetical protein GCM10022240_22220 [Microbacterium kribbense]|uniref:Uncharacterized protein n=1 Tax=Microbacterium kribbense TaxID=433645 RepID=A0ABP7GNM2_9MICO
MSAGTQSMRRHLLAPIAGGAALGAVVALLLWFVGVTAPFAVAAGALVLAGGIAWTAFADTDSPGYHRADPSPRPGTRSDLARVSWSLHSRHGQIGESGRKHLYAFARTRLARSGLDLDDPAAAEPIRALLGDRPYLTLTGRSPVSLRMVADCLTALEAIDSTRPGSRARED